MRQHRIAALLAAIVFCAAAFAPLCRAADAPPQKNDFLTNYIEDGDLIDYSTICDDKCVAAREGDGCFQGYCYFYSNISIEEIGYCVPKRDRPCKVTARLKSTKDEEPASSLRIFPDVIYSVNSGAAKTLKMKSRKGGLWEADIPPQKSGARVDFTIRVIDEYGNVAAGTLPATPRKIRLTRFIKHDDDVPEQAGDDLDIFETSAGFDDEYLYLRFTVQGRISGGTSEPPHINVYGIKISSPGPELMKGILWSYIPLLPEDLMQQLEKAKKIIPLAEEDIDWAINNKSLLLDMDAAMQDGIMEPFLAGAKPEILVDKNIFIGRVKRDAIKATGVDLIQFNIQTAVNESPDSIIPVTQDVSPALVIDFDRHSYVAK